MLKLYWLIPLYIGIVSTATFVVLAIYEGVVFGAVSETLCEDTIVSTALLLLMAIILGILLEWAD